MTKLLRANFARLWKSKIFWLGMAFMIGLSAFAVLARYRDKIVEPDFAFPTLDGLFFVGGVYIAIVIAVFISIFIGTEYSDGTIRNKLVTGHSRISVYFSNLIVCSAASLMMHLSYFVVMICLGFPLMGTLETPVNVVVPLVLCSMVTTVAFVALFLLLSMLIHSKSSGAVVTILLSFILLFATITIVNRLSAPEYYESYTWIEQTADGETIEHSEPAEKNPNYLTGVKREVYEFLCDFLPSGQMLQYGEITVLPDHIEIMPLYSLAIVVVTTACGAYFFRRKDLK